MTDAMNPVLVYAKERKGNSYNAISLFDYPDYYDDNETHNVFSRVVFADMQRVFANTLSFLATNDSLFKEEAKKGISAWVNCNKGYGKNDINNALEFVVKTQKIVESSYLLSINNSSSLREWVENYYLPAATLIAKRKNNWGAWGLYGKTTVARYQGNLSEETYEEAVKWLETATEHFPFIYLPGTMWRENLRSTSGIYYNHYALAPITEVFLIHNRALNTPMPEKMMECIDTLFHYVSFPETWPFKAWPQPFRKLQQLLWPCEDELHVPGDCGYDINLFEMALLFMDRPEFEEHVNHCRPIEYGFPWIFPTAIKELLKQGILK